MQLDVVIVHLSELKLPHHKVRQITFSGIRDLFLCHTRLTLPFMMLKVDFLFNPYLSESTNDNASHQVRIQKGQRLHYGYRIPRRAELAGSCLES